MSFFVPNGPTIPGSGNFNSLTIQKLQTSTVNASEENLSFFDANPVPQLAIGKNAPTNLNDLVTTLTAYGLVTQTTSGRTVTFNNQSSVDVNLLITYGAPVPAGPNFLTKLKALTGTYVWDIPSTLDANYTFNVWAIPPPKQYTPAYNGYTEVEFGFNQTYPDPSNLRDTFDISTVPPGIGSMFNNGPRSSAVAYSASQGYSTQQSYGYNAGFEIIPPPNTLPTQTVTCAQLDGNSAEAVTYPNDTAYPKQQTIMGTGSYTVNVLDPVVSIWPGP
jgi:hypothetical protein